MTPEAQEAVLREMPGPSITERLDQIERALKFTPDRSYRRELVREYLRLTEPEPKELDL